MLANRITSAQRGQSIAKDGVISSVILAAMPSSYDYDTLCFSNNGKVVFNVHLQTYGVSIGTVLFAGNSPFGDLVLESIPDGCELDVEYDEPPVLDSIAPATAAIDAAPFTLTCNGSKFVSYTTIQFAGVDQPTTFVSDTQVRANINPSSYVQGVYPVSVYTSTLLSGSQDFTFSPPSPPMLVTLNPPTASADVGFLLGCVGGNFKNNSVIQINNVDVPTTYVSDTSLTTNIGAGTYAPGNVPVRVRTGSLNSGSVNLIVTEPADTEE